MALVSVPLSGWLPALVTLCTVTLLVYFLSLFRRPVLQPGAPKLASSTWPFVGSIDFYRARQKFWQSEKEKSASGQFSFGYGPFNIIALSGHGARESFYSSRPLDLLPA